MDENAEGTAGSTRSGKNRRFWYTCVWIIGGMLVFALIHYEQWRNFEKIPSKQAFFSQPELLWCEGDSIVLLNRDGRQPRLMNFTFAPDSDTALTPIILPGSKSVSPQRIAVTQERDCVAAIDRELTTYFLTIWANYQPERFVRYPLKFPENSSFPSNGRFTIVDLLWLTDSPDAQNRHLLIFCNRTEAQANSNSKKGYGVCFPVLVSLTKPDAAAAPVPNQVFLLPEKKPAAVEQKTAFPAAKTLQEGSNSHPSARVLELETVLSLQDRSQRWPDAEAEIVSSEKGTRSASHPIADPIFYPNSKSYRFLAVTETDAPGNVNPPDIIWQPTLFALEGNTLKQTPLVLNHLEQQAAPNSQDFNKNAVATDESIISWNWSANGSWFMMHHTVPKPKSEKGEPYEDFEVYDANSVTSPLTANKDAFDFHADITKYPSSFQIEPQADTDPTSPTRRTFLIFATKMQKYGYNLWLKPLPRDSDATISSKEQSKVQTECSQMHQITAQMDIVGKAVSCYRHGKLYIGVVNREANLFDERPHYRVVVIIIAQNDLHNLYPELITTRTHDL